MLDGGERVMLAQGRNAEVLVFELASKLDRKQFNRNCSTTSVRHDERRSARL